MLLLVYVFGGKYILESWKKTKGRKEAYYKEEHFYKTTGILSSVIWIFIWLFTLEDFPKLSEDEFYQLPIGIYLSYWLVSYSTYVLYRFIKYLKK